MTRIPRRIALLAALAAAPAFAAPQISEFTLENGLRAVVIEDHRAPVVTQMVWYEVGAADEPEGQAGIAHFLEHLMFKGTDEIPEGAFSKIVAENGGRDNAFTSRDYTAYFQQIASDRLGLVMQMEADRMRDLELSERAVETERDVVMEERSMRVDGDPGALLRERMDAALYLNHPYRAPIIGWRSEIEELNRADALDFYARFYAPDNAILVVAGDATPEEVKQLAEKHFGVLEASGRPRDPRVAEPPALAPRRVALDDPRVGQPYVVRTYAAPSRGQGAADEAAALTILAEILGGDSVTARLGRTLAVEQGIAINAGAYYSGLSLDWAEFALYGVPAQGRTLTEVEAGLDAVLAELAESGPTEDELARARADVAASEIYAQDSQMGLARSYGAALAVGLSPDDVKGWPDRLKAVTAAQVRDAARALRIEASVTGWLRRAETQGEQG